MKHRNIVSIKTNLTAAGIDTNFGDTVKRKQKIIMFYLLEMMECVIMNF